MGGIWIKPENLILPARRGCPIRGGTLSPLGRCLSSMQVVISLSGQRWRYGQEWTQPPLPPQLLLRGLPACFPSKGRSQREKEAPRPVPCSSTNSSPGKTEALRRRHLAKPAQHLDFPSHPPHPAHTHPGTPHDQGSQTLLSQPGGGPLPCHSAPPPYSTDSIMMTQQSASDTAEEPQLGAARSPGLHSSGLTTARRNCHSSKTSSPELPGQLLPTLYLPPP